jgi:hypothetical protein
MILQKAGVFGDLHIKCADEDEDEKKDESTDGGEDDGGEEAESKDRNWRSKY